MERDMDGTCLLALFASFSKAGGYEELDLNLLHRTVARMSAILEERARRTKDYSIRMTLVTLGHSEKLDSFISRRKGENEFKISYERGRPFLTISASLYKVLEIGASVALEALSPEKRGVIVETAHKAIAFYQGVALHEQGCDY